MLLTLLALSAFSLEGIVELTDATFADTVQNDNSLWLVLFAAEWVFHHLHIVWSLQTIETRTSQNRPRAQQVGNESWPRRRESQ